MFTARVIGLRKTKNILESMFDYIRSPRDTLERAIMYFKDTTEKDVFGTEGRYIGQRWTRLSPSYATWKSKRYPGKGILEATGRMRGNFKTKVSSTRAVLSNPTSYFKYHQLGTRKLPQRVVLFVDRKREKKVLKMFQEDSFESMK